MRHLIVEADGGSRGNPGPAGSGTLVVDADSGEVLAEIGRYLGIATNNVAEYRGAIEGIRFAFALDPEAQLTVKMDSKLVVEQLSGRWKIKHPDMQLLAAEARALIGRRPIAFLWVPRAENSRADTLANRAMDLGADFGPTS
jgi:probable phosphoglycerate mutase